MDSRERDVDSAKAGGVGTRGPVDSRVDGHETWTLRCGGAAVTRN
jgi:hypothetical protein